ncbi:hypothetical protein DBV14_12915 [Variovorax sp. KBW07]|uniref:hypothetical protein n=1 Tax=Variovorax sp. KBW07 TaxID=2153358 RepID=UPI000F56653B|nr:hypothetical protein [Variovorax sp. KBW07]RQO54543.1 hypothetical protein DBV14_12915 [Variovorax sp. KBW07]
MSSGLEDALSRIDSRARIGWLATPLVIANKPQPTPLPASASRIDPQSSQAWLHEVESYLTEVGSLLSNETPK